MNALDKIRGNWYIYTLYYFFENLNQYICYSASNVINQNLSEMKKVFTIIIKNEII